MLHPVFTLKHPWCLPADAFFFSPFVYCFSRGRERHQGWKNDRALGTVHARAGVGRQMLSQGVRIAFIF